jgi:tetratricopeptide (TPR) repeat protein
MKEYNQNQPLLFFRRLALAALLLILVFIVFSNTLSNDFVFDDMSMIKQNAAIRGIRYVKLYFTHPFFAVGQPAIGPVDYDYYRPVVLVSYLLDYLAWKQEPAGYHLTNIFLQSLATILLFLVLNKLKLSPQVSFFAALLFAVHPALADSTAGVSGRSDPLCALFLLAALYCYLIMQSCSPRTRRWLLSACYLTYVLALLTKENALAFPVLVTAYAVLAPDGRNPESLRSRFQNILPIYGISLVYIFWRSGIVHMTHQSGQEALQMMHRGATAALVAADYLFTSFLPHSLYFETFTPLIESLSLKALLAAATLLAMIAAAILVRKRSPQISFFICWFFIFLLPYTWVFLFHPGPVFFTPPHFLYFPLMGLAAVGAIILERFFSRVAETRWKGASVLACSALVIGLFSVQTIHRNTEWHDDFTFFSGMLRHNPLNARTYIGMGSVFLRRGQPEYALAQYAKAVGLAEVNTASVQDQPNAENERAGILTISNHDAAAARAGMGDAYLALQEAPLAVEQYEAAAEESGFDAGIQYKLARACELTGDFDRAIDCYERVLRLNKHMKDAAASRQIALKKKEVYEQAKRVYLTSLLSGKEKTADALYGEAVMLRLTGRRAAAEALFREVVRIEPMNFGANLALGQMLSERGLYEDAFANFSAAFVAEPSSAVTAKELALTSFVLKDLDGAAQWARKAYELAPEEYTRKLAENMIRLHAADNAYAGN